MARNYFENIRTVGASLDQGISKLEDTWKMPHLLLYDTNKDHKAATKKTLDNLRSELKTLEDNIEQDKLAIMSIPETYTEDLEKTKVMIQNLRDEIGDIKVLFLENGYVEQTNVETDLSNATDKLESFSVDENDSFIKDCSYNVNESSLNDNSSFLDSVHQRTPTSYMNLIGTRKKIYNEPPQEPVYSPSYYKVLKKNNTSNR